MSTFYMLFCSAYFHPYSGTPLISICSCRKFSHFLWDLKVYLFVLWRKKDFTGSFSRQKLRPIFYFSLNAFIESLCLCQRLFSCSRTLVHICQPAKYLFCRLICFSQQKCLYFTAQCHLHHHCPSYFPWSCAKPHNYLQVL